MKISEAERRAVLAVLAYGESYGYGNLMTHLSTRWARMLMEKYGMNEAGARAAARGAGYPFQMQDDLLERGEWDESGKRYRVIRRKLGAVARGGRKGKK